VNATSTTAAKLTQIVDTAVRLFIVSSP